MAEIIGGKSIIGTKPSLLDAAHKALAGKTAASKIEVAKGYTAKTSPFPESPFGESPAQQLEHKVYDPPKTSSRATILDNPGESKGGFLRNLFSRDKSKVEIGKGAYTAKTSPFPESPFGESPAQQLEHKVYDPPKTSSRATILEKGPEKPSAAIELGKKPYERKLPFVNSGENPKINGASTDWYEKSPSSKATLLGSDVAETAAKKGILSETVSVAGKVLSNPYFSKGMKIGGVVGSVAGFLVDPGNLTDAHYVKVSGKEVAAGSPAYYDALKSEAAHKLGPGWEMTNKTNASGGTDTYITRKLYDKHGNVSGDQTINLENMKTTTEGEGYAAKPTVATPSQKSTTVAAHPAAGSAVPGSTQYHMTDPTKTNKPADVSHHNGPITVVEPNKPISNRNFGAGSGSPVEHPTATTHTSAHPAVVTPTSAASHVPLSSAAPPAATPTNVPDWAKGMPGWKPGDTKMVEVSTDAPTKTIGYMDKKGDLVYKTENGSWMEDPTGKAKPYVVQKTEPAGGTSTAPHDLPLGTSPNSTSENTKPGGANAGEVNRSAAFNGNGQDTASIPTWHTDIAPDLGGFGGTALTTHGTALAVRDSKDGTKEIAQMADGSYESIDKKTGAVSDAGTWGDGHGGRVAFNGVGNPPLTASNTAPPASDSSPAPTPAPEPPKIPHGRPAADDAFAPVPPASLPPASALKSNIVFNNEGDDGALHGGGAFTAARNSEPIAKPKLTLPASSPHDLPLGGGIGGLDVGHNAGHQYLGRH